MANLCRPLDRCRACFDTQVSLHALEFSHHILNIFKGGSISTVSLVASVASAMLEHTGQYSTRNWQAIVRFLIFPMRYKSQDAEFEVLALI